MGYYHYFVLPFFFWFNEENSSRARKQEKNKAIDPTITELHNGWPTILPILQSIQTMKRDGARTTPCLTPESPHIQSIPVEKRRGQDSSLPHARVHRGEDRHTLAPDDTTLGLKITG